LEFFIAESESVEFLKSLDLRPHELTV